MKKVKIPKILKYRDTSNKYLQYLKHCKNTVKMVSGVVSRSPGADIGRQKIVKQKKKKNDLEDFQGRMRKRSFFLSYSSWFVYLPTSDLDRAFFKIKFSACRREYQSTTLGVKRTTYSQEHNRGYIFGGLAYLENLEKAILQFFLEFFSLPSIRWVY